MILLWVLAAQGAGDAHGLVARRRRPQLRPAQNGLLKMCVLFISFSWCVLVLLI